MIPGTLAIVSLILVMAGFFLKWLDRHNIKRVVKKKVGARAPRRPRKKQVPVQGDGSKNGSNGQGEMFPGLLNDEAKQMLGWIFVVHVVMGFCFGGGMAGVFSAIGFWALLIGLPVVFGWASSRLGTTSAIGVYASRCHMAAGLFLAPLLHYLLWPS